LPFHYYQLNLQVLCGFLAEDDLRFNTIAEKVKAIRIGNTKAHLPNNALALPERVPFFPVVGNKTTSI
jgi:hypothetical protein